MSWEENPGPGSTQWDDATTLWDDGGTVWDCFCQNLWVDTEETTSSWSEDEPVWEYSHE